MYSIYRLCVLLLCCLSSYSIAVALEPQPMPDVTIAWDTDDNQVSIQRPGQNKLQRLIVNTAMDRVDIDPYFFVAAMYDGPGGGAQGGTTTLVQPLTGNPISIQPYDPSAPPDPDQYPPLPGFILPQDEQWLYLAATAGVIPEGPGMICITAPGVPMPTLDPTVPFSTIVPASGMEFVRYSKVDLNKGANGAVLLVRRGIPVRTSVGQFADTKESIIGPTGYLRRRAWPLGSTVTVVKLWEPIIEGHYDSVKVVSQFNVGGRSRGFAWHDTMPLTTQVAGFTRLSGMYLDTSYDINANDVRTVPGYWLRILVSNYPSANTVWWVIQNQTLPQESDINATPNVASIVARAPASYGFLPPNDGWQVNSGAWNTNWNAVTGTNDVVYGPGGTFEFDIFKRLSGILGDPASDPLQDYFFAAENPMGDGQQYRVLVYLSDDAERTNIAPATWLPLVGPKSYYPLPQGETLPDMTTSLDTRMILLWRVNRRPQ